MNRLLFKSVDVATLGFFRLVWGALLLTEALTRFVHVHGIYSPKYAHFRYLLFEWVPVAPNHAFLYVEITILALCAIAILLGVWFRVASVVYALIYFHLFLIDEVYYNNHFYLTILMALLMACTHADRAFSLSSFRSRDKDQVARAYAVPTWEYWLIRGQIFVLYFYGGIAKINADWIRGEPLRYWFNLSGSIKFPLTYVAKQEWFAMMASYGGLVIDLVCPFMLFWKRTRWIAVVIFVSFHLMNSRLFKIGWFPFIAIGLLIPFFEPSAARLLWAKLQYFVAGVRRVEMPDLSKPVRSKLPQNVIIFLFATYFLIQFLVPLRHFLWGQRPDWTEVGQKFSWRMMLRNKDSFIKFTFVPPEAETWINEHPDKRPKIASEHVERMSDHPWMLLQYVRNLDRTLAENGFKDTEIRVFSVVSLNDRPYRVMIDPTVDLTEVTYPLWGIPDWIVPLDPEATQAERPMATKDRLAAIQEGINLYFKENPEKREDIPKTSNKAEKKAKEQ